MRSRTCLEPTHGGRRGREALRTRCTGGSGRVTWGAQVAGVSLVPVWALADGAVVYDAAASPHATRRRHCSAGVAALPPHTRLLKLALDVRGAVAGD